MASLPLAAQEAGPPTDAATPGSEEPGGVPTPPEKTQDPEAPPPVESQPDEAGQPAEETGEGSESEGEAADTGGPDEEAAPQGDGGGDGDDTVEIAFLGVHAGPEQAELGFRVEEQVRVALDEPPFVLAESPSSPIAPDCLEDDACRQEKVAAMAAAWIVVGALTLEGRELALTLYLVEQSSGSREARAFVAAPATEEGEGRLLASLDPAVRALVQTIDPQAGPPVPLDAAPVEGERTAAGGGEEEDGDLGALDDLEEEEGAGTRLWPEDDEDKVSVEDEDKRIGAKPAKEPLEEPAEAGPGINYGAWVWSGGFLAAGASAALIGIGFDLLSPTSTNDELDVFDAVGPGLVVVGAGVALVGLVVNPFLWLSAQEEGEDDEG